MLRRLNSWIKRLALTFGALYLVAICALFGVRLWLHSASGQSVLKRQLVAKGVQIGQIRWESIWSSRARLENLKIEADAAGQRLEISAASAQISLAPWRMLGGVIAIRDVDIPQLQAILTAVPVAPQTQPPPTATSRELGLMRKLSVEQLQIADFLLSYGDFQRRGQLEARGWWSPISGDLALDVMLAPNSLKEPHPFWHCSLALEKGKHEANVKGAIDPGDPVNRDLDAPLPWNLEMRAKCAEIDRFWSGQIPELPFEFHGQLQSVRESTAASFALSLANRCSPIAFQGNGECTSRDRLAVQLARIEAQSPLGRAQGAGGIEDGQWRECQLELELKTPLSLPRPFKSIPASRGIVSWSGPLVAPSVTWSALPFGKTPGDLGKVWKLQLDRLRSNPAKWIFDLLQEDRAQSQIDKGKGLRQVASGEVLWDREHGGNLSIATRGILPHLKPLENLSLAGFFALQAELSPSTAAEAKSRWRVLAQVQDLQAEDLRAEGLKLSGSGSLTGEVKSMGAALGEVQGRWQLATDRIAAREFIASELIGTVERNNSNTAFDLQVGELNSENATQPKVSAFNLSGTWQGPNLQTWVCSIDALRGQVNGESLATNGPWRIACRDQKWSLMPSEIGIGSGSLRAEAECGDRSFKMALDANRIPLGLFENWTRFSTEEVGSGAVNWSSDERGLILTSHLRAHRLGDTDISSGDSIVGLDVAGRDVSATWNAPYLEQPLLLTGQLPIEVSSTFPFVFLNRSAPMRCEAELAGEVSALAQLALPANTTVGGYLSLKLTGSGSPAKPSWTGSAQIQRGKFSHDETHLHLREIEGTLVANGRTITWENLTGRDLAKGIFRCRGEAQWWPHLALRAIADLRGLNYRYSDFAKGRLDGELKILADGGDTHLKGTLSLADARIDIPDQISTPTPLPIKGGEIAVDRERSAQPLNFDIDIAIPPRVQIHGRGLNSNWEGTLHLGGTSSAPALQGVLTLNRGTFVFCGREFRIVESQLRIGVDSPQDAQLRLVGEHAIEGATVRAVLQGPLTSPKLSFESYPQLSIDEMLAQVLFGRSFNNITPVQALQVADAAMMVSGGLSPIEQLRRTVKLDHFDLQQPESEESAYVVQVGKYLKNGVLVGVKQSIAPDSSDMFSGTQFTLEMPLRRHLHVKTEVGYSTDKTITLLWKRDY